jgi:hypothetical protein
MTAPQPEQQSSLAAGVVAPDDTMSEGEKHDSPRQARATMDDAPEAVKKKTLTMDIVDEIMPAAAPVSEPASCSSSTVTSPSPTPPSASPTPEDSNMSPSVVTSGTGAPQPERRLPETDAEKTASEATITEQEQQAIKTEVGEQNLGFKVTEPMQLEPDLILSEPATTARGIKTRKHKHADTQPVQIQYTIKVESGQRVIFPTPNKVRTSPDPKSEEPSPKPMQEDLAFETCRTVIAPESIEEETKSDHTAHSANIQSLSETHSSLSSYIKRSLSGLFSDIASLTHAAQEAYPVESSREQPLDQGDDYPASHLNHAEEHKTDTFEGHEDVADSLYDAAPVRKRSRLDLTAYHARSEPHIVQDPLAATSSPKQPSGLTRRRSFSYRCLAQLFHMNDDTPTDDPQPSETVQVVYSPGTVTDPTHADAETPMMIDGQSPFKIPCHVLEESESMSSFIQVLGAVDLDCMDNGDEYAMSSGAPPSVKLSPEGDAFGWYVSEESQDHLHMAKEPPHTFLPPVDAMEEPLTIDDTCPIEQWITSRVVDSAKAAGEGQESSSGEAEDSAHEKTLLLERLPHTPGYLMEQENQENQSEETTLDESSTKVMAAREAELEYARAADTVDSVLGDFFC